MYNIVYAKEAKNIIHSLSNKKKLQIEDAIKRIATNPKIGKFLTQELKGLVSYRSGPYRIIYRIYHNEIMVLILTIGHRKDVYRKMSRRLNRNR